MRDVHIKDWAIGVGLTPFKWQWGRCTVLPGKMIAIGPFRFSWRF